MDTGSWLLLLSIILLVGLIISRPFFRESESNVPGDSDLDSLSGELAELAIEKENLLTSLQDLDNDHDLERLPDEAYAGRREVLLHASARVIHRMDALEKQVSAAQTVNEKAPLIETKGISGGRDEIEEMISARRKLRDEVSAGFCPRCGKVIQKSDQYCPACGSKVAG